MAAHVVPQRGRDGVGGGEGGEGGGEGGVGGGEGGEAALIPAGLWGWACRRSEQKRDMPDSWDASAADGMLAAHELSQLDALLRHWINTARSPEAVDWVDARAEEGHVPAPEASLPLPPSGEGPPRRRCTTYA